MAKNLNQLPTAAASILATDKMYIARSPFGATDDRYILGSSIISQFPAPLTTKGDIYTYSTVAARLPVGATDGMLLQVSAAAATGLAWSSVTFPTTSATSGKIVISDGTNWIASTSIWPNTVGSSGKIVISNGASNVYSTPTYPNASVTAGKIIISDGTNYISSTPTFPNTAASTGSFLYADGTNWVASTSLWANTVGSAGKIIRSDGTTNTYSTATFADTYAINTILYASAADTVTGLATANSASLVTSSAGVPAWSSSMTNGQVIIGSTGATPTAATLSSSGNISITNGAASITIGTSGFASFSWTTASINTSMAINTGYITLGAGVLTMTLPTTAAVGSVIRIAGQGAGGWSIAQSAGQTIHFGSSNTTTGAGGSLSSTNRYDSVELVCSVANLDFVVVSCIGNLTVV